MQNNLLNLHKPAVTFCLIAESTKKGIQVKSWCLSRSQYKAIKRAGNVRITNIGKANYKLLTTITNLI